MVLRLNPISGTKVVQELVSAVAVLVSSCGGWGLHGTRLVVAWSTAPVSEQ